jgi:hypothetical protein
MFPNTELDFCYERTFARCSHLQRFKILHDQQRELLQQFVELFSRRFAAEQHRADRFFGRHVAMQKGASIHIGTFIVVVTPRLPV